MKRTIDYSLYLVTDRKVTDKKGRDFYEAVEEALQAGITLVQLREKDVTTEERIAIGRKVKILCDHYDVPLLVDDDIACAKAIGADGVHLGQSDESLARGRQELGNDAIIGISAHNLEEGCHRSVARNLEPFVAAPITSAWAPFTQQRLKRMRPV